MPINNNYFIFFDFETTDKTPKTCEILEIGALVMDPRTYKLIPDKFITDVKPPEGTYISPEALAKNGFTIERINKAPSIDQVWPMFQKFVSKYNIRGGPWGYPIPCGANIKGYDLIITERMCRRYKMMDKEDNPKLFHRQKIQDIYDWLLPWFENKAEPDDYKMDTLRDYFGISKDGAHTALKDCHDVYRIARRFWSWQRKLAANIDFKGKFTDDQETCPIP